MTKRFLCFVLSLILMASLGAQGIYAKDTEESESQIIYFRPADSWKDYKTVFCYIVEYNGDSLANWQTKKTICTPLPDGRYSYDIRKVGGIEEGKYYMVIFSADARYCNQHEVLFTTECLGDTLICTDTKTSSPEGLYYHMAFWENQDRSVYGPLMQITSIGNIIGTCLPPYVSPAQMFSDFLPIKLDNARLYSGKTDQEIIDYTIERLGLSPGDAEKIIADSGVQVNWIKAESEANKEQIIYFRPSDDWEGDTIYCHIAERDGSTLANWQSKKEICTPLPDGRYSYDIRKVGGIEEGKLYFVVFSTDRNKYNQEQVLLRTECLGDSLICTDITYPSPEGLDYYLAFWENQDRYEYGSLRPWFWGDLDLSGEVNIKDATAIQKHLAGLPTGKFVFFQYADFDRDEDITITDATAIQKYIAGSLEILKY